MGGNVDMYSIQIIRTEIILSMIEVLQMASDACH
jgi:hypothetical protein